MMKAEGGSEQLGFQKERIKQLEKDLERAIKEKTDGVYEVRRLQGMLDSVEKEAKESKFAALRNEGDVQNTRTVLQRLES